MSRSVIALFCADESETMTLRAIVLKRLLQAVLLCIVALASFLTETIISAIFLSGIEL